MLTRTAIYEGAPKPGREEEFFRRVREELEPVWRRFPDVLAVRVQRVRERDPDAAAIAMILEMDWASHDAMTGSLASEVKESAHAATLEVMRLFEGRFYHVVAEFDRFGPAAQAGRPEQMPTAG